jgi:hypothetical protein
VLFDGNQEADELLRARSEQFLSNMAVEYELLKVPANTSKSAELAGHYRNTALGDITVTRTDSVTTFDFGEWKSEVGSRENPDGTVSFMTIEPGITGLEFVVGPGEDKTLIMRDAQHEYVFDALTSGGESSARK